MAVRPPWEEGTVPVKKKKSRANIRNKIFGSIGILWGGFILANGLLGQRPQGSEAYQAGFTGALVFGGLMFVAGAYYFFKQPKPKEE